ncbi:LEA type 2 family protein [Nibrella saemangeumensis]
MKKIAYLLVLVAIPLLLSQCSVNKQLAEAKALGDCKFNILSADSVYVSGYNIREFRNIRNLEDFNPLKYPRIASGLLLQNIPVDALINLEITNPNNRLAAINQLEYRVLLADVELVNGLLNQRIEVAPGGGRTVVPVRLRTNAYRLITDPNTSDAFINFVRNLAGTPDNSPSTLTIKLKPTLALGNKQVDYPGYITINQQVTNKILTGGR